MTLTYTLRPECRNQLPDAAGGWTIEGGTVLEKRKVVGRYSVVGRMSCGTRRLETTMVWLTLFFTPVKNPAPPENLTLHGAQNLGNNNGMGSVSAASPAFALHIGKQFKRVGNTLKIQ